jgi:hypothetical protein
MFMTVKVMFMSSPVLNVVLWSAMVSLSPSTTFPVTSGVSAAAGLMVKVKAPTTPSPRITATIASASVLWEIRDPL